MNSLLWEVKVNLNLLNRINSLVRAAWHWVVFLQKLICFQLLAERYLLTSLRQFHWSNLCFFITKRIFWHCFLSTLSFLPSSISGLICQSLLSSLIPSLPFSLCSTSECSWQPCRSFICIYLGIQNILELPTGVVVRKQQADSVNCACSKPAEPLRPCVGRCSDMWKQEE